MLTLLTSNTKKYTPFHSFLTQIGVKVVRPDFELPEIQSDDFNRVVLQKARQAHDLFGGPCLVDDAGLLLDAYPGFPGPLTKQVCERLGAEGMERLLAGTTRRATLQCYLACWISGRFRCWKGEVVGTVDPLRSTAAVGPGPLTSWFVPDDPTQGAFAHRRLALEALAEDIDQLRRDAAATDHRTPDCGGIANPACVFCAEFAGHPNSVFRQVVPPEVTTRIVHETARFVVFPPLGQFVEGGLLLATKAHFMSLASLPDAYFDELERLVMETSVVLQSHYGERPIFFEHGPRSATDKGTCCVDHAHLNIFPVAVDVTKHLAHLPCRSIDDLQSLTDNWRRNQPYLYVQTNEGRRFVYDVEVVPSQYIRKIIAQELGFADRWHWRDYLGLEELTRTLNTLGGWK